MSLQKWAQEGISVLKKHVVELQAAISLIEDIARLSDATAAVVSNVRPSKANGANGHSNGTNGHAVTRDLTMTKLVMESITPECTSADVVAQVRARRPRANKDTIRSMLSRFAREGQIKAEGERHARRYWPLDS